MTEQLDTNADASAVTESIQEVLADADATVTASADAVTDAEQALADALVNAMIADEAAERAVTDALTDDITRLFDRTLEQLVARRDARYADAIKEFERESEALAKEYGELEVGIKDIEATLPARTRLNQHDVDVLLVSGKRYAVRDKLAEIEVVKSELAAMKERLGVIQDRFLSIDQEKQDSTRNIFELWYSKTVQPTVRAAERGLLITLLEGLSADFSQFQARTGTGMSDNKHHPLVNQGHFIGLTADGRSPEFAAGHKWYG